ncbi:MAG: hypothetical protein ABI988_13830, partial [Nitrospirota bacterium]
MKRWPHDRAGPWMQWEGAPASKSLVGGQENLFLYTDMAEKPSSKLRKRALINMLGMNHSRLKQRIKSPVVVHEKVGDRPYLFVLSRSHSLPPIMSSSEGRKELWVFSDSTL